MSFFNKSIKNKSITGFEKINEREVLLNLNDISILNPFVEKLTSKGFNITLIKV